MIVVVIIIVIPLGRGMIVPVVRIIPAMIVTMIVAIVVQNMTDMGLTVMEVIAMVPIATGIVMLPTDTALMIVMVAIGTVFLFF